ncbi:MAG: hypothetical protein JSS61_05475 [Verrucomicrobia bacterium]|nr:hypothetical protein [Verrucomicrobiota bacterium]
MSAPAFNVSPLVPVLRKVVSEIDASSTLEGLSVLSDSAPFALVTGTSLKNVVTLITKEQLPDWNVSGCERSRYAEAALMAYASLVYKAVATVFLAIATAFTLGQNASVIRALRRSLVHAALAIATIAISVIGVVSPIHGAKASGYALLGACGGLIYLTKNDIAKNLSAVYWENRAEIEQAAKEGFEGNEALYNAKVAPLMAFLDSKIKRDEHATGGELIEIFQGIVQRFPRVHPEFSREHQAIIEQDLDDIQDRLGIHLV